MPEILTENDFVEIAPGIPLQEKETLEKDGWCIVEPEEDPVGDLQRRFEAAADYF